MIDTDDEDDRPEGTLRCEWCEGYFLPEDMDVDYCNECAHSLRDEGQ